MREPLVGGVNNVTLPEFLKPGELQVCENMYPVGGKLVSRKGTTAVTALNTAISSAFASGEIYKISIWYMYPNKKPADMTGDMLILVYGRSSTPESYRLHAFTPESYRLHAFYETLTGWKYYAGGTWSPSVDLLSGIYSIAGYDFSTKRDVRFSVCGDKVLIADGYNPIVFVSANNLGEIESGINQVYSGNKFPSIGRINTVEWSDATLGAQIPSGSIMQVSFSLKTKDGAVSGSSPIYTLEDTGGLWISPAVDQNPGTWKKYIQKYVLADCFVDEKNSDQIKESINGVVIGRRTFTYSEAADTVGVMSNVGSAATTVGTNTETVSVIDGFPVGTEDIIATDTIPPVAVDVAESGGMTIAIGINNRFTSPLGNGHIAIIYLLNQNPNGAVNQRICIRLFANTVLKTGDFLDYSISQFRLYYTDLKTPITCNYQLSSSGDFAEIWITVPYIAPSSTTEIYLCTYDFEITVSPFNTFKYGLWVEASEITDKNESVFTEPMVRSPNDIIVSQFGESDREINPGGAVNRANRSLDSISNTSLYVSKSMGTGLIPSLLSASAYSAPISDVSAVIFGTDSGLPTTTSGDFTSVAAGSGYPYSRHAVKFTCSAAHHLSSGMSVIIYESSVDSYNSEQGSDFNDFTVIKIDSSTEFTVYHKIDFSSTATGKWSFSGGIGSSAAYSFYKYCSFWETGTEERDKFFVAKLSGNTSPATIRGCFRGIDSIEDDGISTSVIFSDVSQWHWDRRKNHCIITGWYFGTRKGDTGYTTLVTCLSSVDTDGDYGLTTLKWNYALSNTYSRANKMYVFHSIDFYQKKAFLLILDASGNPIFMEEKTNILPSDKDYLPVKDSDAYRRALMLSAPVWGYWANAWRSERLRHKPNATTEAVLANNDFFVDDFVYERGTYYGPEDMGNICRLLSHAGNFSISPLGVDYHGDLAFRTDEDTFLDSLWTFGAGWSGSNTAMAKFIWPGVKSYLKYNDAIREDTAGYNDFYWLIFEARGDSKHYIDVFIGDGGQNLVQWNRSDSADWVLNIFCIPAIYNKEADFKALCFVAEENLFEAGEAYIKNVFLFRNTYNNNITFGSDVVTNIIKSEPNKIMWSEPNSLSFPTLNNRILPEAPVAVISSNVVSSEQRVVGAFIIFTRNRVFQFSLTGTPGNWQSSANNLTPIDANSGLYSSSSLVVAESTIYWLSDAGFMRLSQDGIANISDNRLSVPEIGSSYTTVVGVYDSGRKHILWCFYGTSLSYTVVYDVIRQVWVGVFTNLKFVSGSSVSGTQDSLNGDYLLINNAIYKYPGTAATGETCKLNTRIMDISGRAANSFSLSINSSSRNIGVVDVTTYKGHYNATDTLTQKFLTVYDNQARFLKHRRGKGISLSLSETSATEIEYIEIRGVNI